MPKNNKENNIANKTDIGDIASEWKPDVVNWDLIQRMRFMNADAEIDPEDSYSTGERNFED